MITSELAKEKAREATEKNKKLRELERLPFFTLKII
jgi:hypothetical protein